MKKKIETKKDDLEFDRFDSFLRRVVAVPKDEIVKREQEGKQKKLKKNKKMGLCT